MSLDEAKRKLEQLKLEMEEKKKKGNKTKAKPKKTKSKSSSLESKIGEMDVAISKQILDLLLDKIWTLDNIENEALDKDIKEIYQNEIGQHPLLVDSQKLFSLVRDQSFFKLRSGKLLSYNEFRQTWQNYCGAGKMYILSGRKEFVKFLTNKYKMNWVDQNGQLLKEGTFQLLYRLEREPKAVERIAQEISYNYNLLIDDKRLDNYLFQFRKAITKLIKKELLAFKS
ncbi:hypothetical protein NEF87_003539 [Candidatus Lokiarchaeum ossiferum]|uniref:Uncharacterized protein n=1 Tax=Candidatus Lokiarchaeum ossiferum TaxID=2951803 RepID=A0ABY6HXI0_9ARCH|nr:hypothetical protein NEF87_003539 [Candidatus Lokiarchaeum sp. B-35]